MLSEMSDKVDQSKRRQYIRLLLVPRVLKADNVRVHFPRYDRVPTQESVERILNIHKLVKIIRGEVRSDERGPLCARKYFAVHQILPVEAHGFNDLYLWSLPHDSPTPP